MLSNGLGTSWLDLESAARTAPAGGGRAGNDTFSNEDTSRTLDIAERLLIATGAMRT